MAFGEYAYSILTPFPNNPVISGDQVYVDTENNIEGEVEYYLINPLNISIENIGEKVFEYGGIIIPAHADRPAFSMTSQLGVIVNGPWAAIECVRIPPSMNGALVNTLGYPLITSSDAHFPEHVARRPFKLDVNASELLPRGTEADIEVLKRALLRRPG
jgi:PHP family Zn ribbon phosphoesterase